ncbi:hypothetical protein [Fulvimarina pelagi]|nr:hypothetical protein [Fulvimarina pelagi]
MRAAICLIAALLLSSCAMPSPEVRNADWENNAYLLNEPATNY